MVRPVTPGAYVPIGATAVWYTVERIEGANWVLYNAYRFESWEDREGTTTYGWRRISKGLDGNWVAGYSTYDEAAAVAKEKSR